MNCFILAILSLIISTKIIAQQDSSIIWNWKLSLPKVITVLKRQLPIQSPLATSLNDEIKFRDTIFDCVTDSLVSTLHIKILKGNTNFSSAKKPFKYIGNDKVFIEAATTQDPHYICEYPNEPLEKEKIYYLKICFAFGSIGSFQKRMYLHLSNGKLITLTYQGEIKWKAE